ncbi:hypothetical protein CRP01_33130 [Flavilitoribacter nigricans DSM 23189 = NBRC 102662]|uniref:Uncharacterized protein n=1 Tax=Flavilitoribacter nigricans (strain ATCC 23147 / DSM 23189 / NBRC 102662 / NCIMB 1420 / SS-2) TaxID=1122177 RepID=A0A2D0N0X8_FLAN2|nr:hypothetical protein CRP01_33130 [Flavilitoribacter nigricans DSM 23189 = NBRC 102662]
MESQVHGKGSEMIGSSTVPSKSRKVYNEHLLIGKTVIAQKELTGFSISSALSTDFILLFYLLFGSEVRVAELLLGARIFFGGGRGEMSGERGQGRRGQGGRGVKLQYLNT